jgi:serine/threonine-protein kinase
VPDPVVSSADTELRAHVERALNAHYELDQEIGRGGMGIVYRAKDRRLKRTVAIKLLPPELAFRSEIRSRFLREAETAAQLSHPNIVPIYSVDERDGLVYFAMACIDGDNLAKLLHERGRFDVDETRRILREVADALAYAHGRGVVHRDIKPDNIILDRDNRRPMVTDFGIARAVTDGADSRLTATGMAIGTPAYMSPEQAAGDREIDGRSDLYSLGIVGYHMLAGELPFAAGSTPAMLVKHISERPAPLGPRRPDAPADLTRAVMMLLEKDPANRFPSAQALVLALDNGDTPELATNGDGAAPSYSTNGYPVWQQSASSGHYEDGPTSEELTRWDAPPVLSFRRKVMPYVFVNAVIVFLAIFTGTSFLTVTAFWSVFMAFRYAKLWSEGYDWHDVFRQPRERLLYDLAAETIDDVRGLIDSKTRSEILARSRERARQRRQFTGGSSDPRQSIAGIGAPRPSGGRTIAALPAAPLALPASSPHGDALRKADSDRDEVARLVSSMPRAERDQLADVVESATALRDKIRALAATLADLDRNSAPGAVDVIEREITTLEAQANPLDRAASEDRVRRLAYLKRQRRAVADVDQRRSQVAARLESCRLALENMRYDVLRLKTGAESHQHITLIAERAMSLARDVDTRIYAADEVSRLTRARG